MRWSRRGRRPLLWNGADAVWEPPHGTSAIEGELAPGDRVVVVDAGEHHVGSFGALVRVGTRPAQPPRGGVAVEREDGARAVVAAHHLRLVAPDHPLRPEPDASHADWWLEQLEEWRPDERHLRVAALVPRSLPAVAAVLHPFRDGGGARSWTDVADAVGARDRTAVAEDLARAHGGTPELGLDDAFEGPDNGRLDLEVASALVNLLSASTSTPDDTFVAIWEGFGHLPPQKWPGAARVAVPARGHVLLRGPLDGVLRSVTPGPWAEETVSGIWWPADRAWFVQTEIDFEWTFVAGARGLVEQLVDEPGLEVVVTDHDRSTHDLG